MATCLTLLVLAWVLLLNSFAAKADTVSVTHLVCATNDFSPNVDLQLNVSSSGSSLNMILTDESGNSPALSYSQLNLNQEQVKSLSEQHSAVLRLNDPISGPQLLAIQNGNGYVSWTNAKGQNTLIEVKNCK